MTGFVNDRVLNNEDVTGISILMEYRHRTVVLVSPDKVNPSPNPKKIAGTRAGRVKLGYFPQTGVFPPI